MAKPPRLTTTKYNRIKTTVEFPPDVWAKVKLAASEKKVTVNKIVVDACAEVCGMATQEEIDQVLPGHIKTGSRLIFPSPTPAAQPVFRPWENCVISTTPTIASEPELKPAPAKIEQPQKTAKRTPPGSPKRYSEAAHILMDGFKGLDS